MLALACIRIQKNPYYFQYQRIELMIEASLTCTSSQEDGFSESKPKLSSDNMNSKDSPECEKRAPYRVLLSAHFMASILIVCVAIGFAGGRTRSVASFVENVTRVYAYQPIPNADKPLEPTPVLKETQHFVIDEDGMIEFEVSKFGDGFFSNEKEPCSDEDDSNATQKKPLQVWRTAKKI